MVELLAELMPPVVLVGVVLVAEVAGFDATDAGAYVRTGLTGFGNEATFTTTAEPDGIVRVDVRLSASRSDALEMVDDLRRV